jgi:hypothetical protein
MHTRAHVRARAHAPVSTLPLPLPGPVSATLPVLPIAELSKDEEDVGEEEDALLLLPQPTVNAVLLELLLLSAEEVGATLAVDRSNTAGCGRNEGVASVWYVTV